MNEATEQKFHNLKNGLIRARDRLRIIAKGEEKGVNRLKSKDEWHEPGLRKVSLKRAQEIALHTANYIDELLRENLG